MFTKTPKGAYTDEYRAARRAWMNRRYEEDPEFRARVNARNRAQYQRRKRESLAYQLTYRQQARQECMVAYGGWACRCCGETRPEFLGLDHIEGGGHKHRMTAGHGTSVYVALRRDGFPPGYQVLCHNCNFAKGFYGGCPHQGPTSHPPIAAVYPDRRRVEGPRRKHRPRIPRSQSPLFSLALEPDDRGTHENQQRDDC